MNQLVESISRYREIAAEMDFETASRDEIEQLARSADCLIQQLAREIVLRGAVQHGRN